MSELPAGWVRIPTSQACTMVRGVTYNKTESSDEPLLEYLPVLRANNIQAGKLVFSDLVYVPKKCIAPHQVIKADDVVVAMSSGSKSVVGKAAKAESDWEGAFGAFCGVLRPSNEINPRYFYFFTQSAEYRTRVSELSAGVNINNLKPAHFEMIEMAVAPLAEQTRIAAKLDELLAQVDTLKARIDGIPALLKRFRQSVLAAAVSGRLTEEWRRQNGPLLLEKSSTPPLNKTDIYAEDRIKQPTHWHISALGNIATFQQGLQITKSERRNSPSQDSLPILRTVNYETGFIEDVHYAVVNNKSIIAEPEDIILSRTGTVGRVLTGYKGVMHNNSFRINFSRNHLARGYLIVFLTSPLCQEYIKKKAGKSSQPDLTHKEFAKCPVLLPHLNEQIEIVRRVEQLFTFADQLEARVKAAQARIDRLTQSILAKAFRGALVPQDPDDEPASVLLERIKAQRAAAPKAKRGRRTATSS
jgi:type I restriction enzyme S subunit